MGERPDADALRGARRPQAAKRVEQAGVMGWFCLVGLVDLSPVRSKSGERDGVFFPSEHRAVEMVIAASVS